MDWQNPHFNFQVPVRKKVHKEVSRLCSFSTFCFITWVCDSRVERLTLSYIPDHRFLVRHESHRLSRSSTLLRFGKGRGGFPKRHINHISKWSRSYLFTPFSPSLKSQSRRCSLFLCAASPSQVSPSKVPSCVLHSKPLKDLFDIEQGGIISFPLKTRDAVI